MVRFKIGDRVTKKGLNKTALVVDVVFNSIKVRVPNGKYGYYYTTWRNLRNVRKV